MYELKEKDKDKLIFLEEPHEYYFNGRQLTSVTTVIHKYSQEFDKEKACDMMLKGSEKYTGPKEDYFGMDRNEIQQKWEDICTEACDYGTAVHLMAEQYVLNEPYTDIYPSELEQVKAFFKHSGFTCEVPEIQLYSTQWGIAGTADLLLKKDGVFHIYDWKTNRGKDLADHIGNQYTKFMKYPLNHLPDLPYWHYAIQMSVYRLLMETEDNCKSYVKQGQMAIVHIKEGLKYPQVITVPYLKTEAINMLKHFNNLPM